MASPHPHPVTLPIPCPPWDRRQTSEQPCCFLQGPALRRPLCSLQPSRVPKSHKAKNRNIYLPFPKMRQPLGWADHGFCPDTQHAAIPLKAQEDEQRNAAFLYQEWWCVTPGQCSLSSGTKNLWLSRWCRTPVPTSSSHLSHCLGMMGSIALVIRLHDNQ